MSDFDPDAYISAKKAKAGFDPDAYLKAKTEQRAAEGVTVDGAPAESAKTVETPQGPRRMVNGRPVLDPEEQETYADNVAARRTEGVWKATLSGIQGPANFLTDRVAGAKAAISAVPKWFKGDLGHSLGDEYAKGRDEARAVVDDAVREYPTAPLVGSLVTAPLSPVGASAFARIGSGVATGGLAGFGASRGDSALEDAAEGAALGGVIGGGMELAGKGFSALAKGASTRADAVRAAKQAQIEKEVAKEISTIKGQFGGESQKGERILENLQRARAGLPAAPSESLISPELQQRALDALASPEAQSLQQSVLTNNLERLPSQASTIGNLKTELADAVANKGSEIAKRTNAYWGDSLLQTEIVPRVGNLLGRTAIGAAGGAALYGAGEAMSALTGNDRWSKAGGITGGGAFGGAVLGAPGVKAMIKNFAASPRVRDEGLRVIQDLGREGGRLAPQLGNAATQNATEISAGTGQPSAPRSLLQLAAPLSSGALQPTWSGGAPAQRGTPTPPRATPSPNPSQPPEEEEDAGVRAFQSGGI